MSPVNPNPLLALLADGLFHSEAELVSASGLNAAELSRHLHEVEQWGVELESRADKGYRIPGGLSLLNTAMVHQCLSPVAAQLLTSFQLHPSIDSTNAELLRQAGQGICAGTVCVAEQQTAGRGRRGRHWVSPFGRNIYLSILWEYASGPAALEGLSLAVGVAVSRALSACSVDNVRLKWPNDVLIGDAKLGGILLELRSKPDGACQVVVGVGINVAMPEMASAAIDQTWVDIARDAEMPDRSRLLAALLNELLPMLSQYESAGFESWRDEWLALDAYASEPVVLISGDQRQEGVARGVDETGALRLETAAGIELFFGGEVSMRPVRKQ
ncbi:MAG: bifunctional biotin--[acetyl-CoA-carboxylase] ligase/biotin operon repressor BirA [Halioglobus sp.]